MIESIRIKNFRGIQAGRIDRFRKFSLLVGPNNSGKSAVSEALYLAGTASRKALLITSLDPNTGYNATIADRDLLGDDPLSRVWARHSYVEPQARWDNGKLTANVSDPLSPIKTFFLSAPGVMQGQEPNVALLSIGAETVKDLRGNPESPLLTFAKWLFGGETTNPKFFGVCPTKLTGICANF